MFYFFFSFQYKENTLFRTKEKKKPKGIVKFFLKNLKLLNAKIIFLKTL